MVEGGKELPLQRLLSSGMHVEKETIVEETAIQLRAINSDNEEYTHATLLATPSNLIELHAGHLFSEGYIHSPPIRSDFKHSFNLHHAVLYQKHLDVSSRDRIVTSSCGACNHPDLMVESYHDKVDSKLFNNMELSVIVDALSNLSQAMSLFEASGGSHGAGLFDNNKDLLFVCEDIGRHNAVDKVIGKALLNNFNDFHSTMLLLSGRCGWDIVAKAVRSGIPAIASLGALSTAAIDLARDNGVILYGFVKENGGWKVG
ncbi:MAG: formate dehydrogenase accessory sulfurtransferase FdhD [Candidatus Thermoplasmatota archaeon]|nr:formate dehydrogenase accessory sulfurtransferase FdhD [Candidatus Thermoplasmatota archaeon]